MSIVACKECHHPVSTKASGCPHCGAKRRSYIRGWLVVLLIALNVVVYLALVGPPPIADAPKHTNAHDTPVQSQRDTRWQHIEASSDPADKKLASEVSALDVFTACLKWGEAARSRAKRRAEVFAAFLASSDAISRIDESNVPNRTAEVGMTTCGILAALGRPNDINLTTTASASSQQIVYRERGIYVYTEARPGQMNGRVTTIQH